MRLNFLAGALLWSLVSCSPKTEQNVAFLKRTSIINGQNVESSHILAQSIVGVYNVKNEAICTGTLIGANLVLTAAHCVPEKASHTKIIFSLDLDSTINSRELDIKQDYMLSVTDFKVAPGWNPKDLSEGFNKKDLALMKFKGPIPTGFKPATFLHDTALLKPGISVTVAGFGVNDVEVEKINPTQFKGLEEAIEFGEVICDEDDSGKRGDCFSIYTYGEGLLRYTEAPISKIHTSEVELDEKKAGTCVGDSGGPAFIKINDSYFLFGVTSRGSAFCDEVGVYTNALYFLKWINDTAKILK